MRWTASSLRSASLMRSSRISASICCASLKILMLRSRLTCSSHSPNSAVSVPTQIPTVSTLISRSDEPTNVDHRRAGVDGTSEQVKKWQKTQSLPVVFQPLLVQGNVAAARSRADLDVVEHQCQQLTAAFQRRVHPPFRQLFR